MTSLYLGRILDYQVILDVRLPRVQLLAKYAIFPSHLLLLYSILFSCGPSVLAVPNQYPWRITPDQLSNAILPTEVGPNSAQDSEHHSTVLMADPRQPPQGGPGWRRLHQPFSTDLPNQFPTTTTAKPLTLADIPIISLDAELSFHANETLLHVRTANWIIAHGTCLEMRYRLEGKRTRLLTYTCGIAEGGMCVLDKFMADPSRQSEGTISIEQCHKLQPWMFASEPFAFHFRFVRRPRRFSDRESELRHMRRRHGKRALREVGRVTLKGFKQCSQACRRNGENGWQDDKNSYAQDREDIFVMNDGTIIQIAPSNLDELTMNKL